MKKFLISSILTISLITMMAIPGFATSLFQTSDNTVHLSGSDLWTRGISQGTEYYMSYSYYNNYVTAHAAKATIDGLGTTTLVYAPGATAKANSTSRPSYSTANIYAATCGSTWHYVKDTGNGDYTVSGW